MIKLNGIFSDGAVLPHDKPFKIYGESDGETSVYFNGVKRTIMPVLGRFFAEFPPMPCGGAYQIEAVCGSDKVVVNDVYVGDVYLVAGQSNVMFKVKECSDNISDVQDDPLLRCLFADHVIFYDGDIDRFRFSDGWISCLKKDVPDWTAIPFFMGSELRKKHDCAVGMINCYQGASVIQSWLPQEAFLNERLNLSPSDMHTDHFDYDIWNRRSLLYDKVFGQIKPYSVNAIVWYQGESNTTVKESEIYAEQLKILATSWRKDLGDENLPFIIVQIADLNCRNDDGWHSLQKAQQVAATQIKNAKLVISKDLCSTDCIHPPEKKDLAKRIVKALEQEV